MRKLSVGNSFLAEAAEALKKGQAVRIKIGGESMYPFIRGGKDIVDIVPCPPEEELKRWSCYLYYWEGKYMVHRYIGAEGGYGLFIGDGNLARIERVKRNEVVGRLLYIQRPDGRRTDCSDKLWLAKGRLWHYLKPLRIGILPLLKRIYRP